MKSDKDNISKNEREIDEFLSKFEALDEDDSANVPVEHGTADSSQSSKGHKNNKNKRNNKGIKRSASKSSKKKSGASLSGLIRGNGEPLKDRLFLKDNPYYNPSLGADVIVNGKKIKNTPKVVSKGKIAKDIVGLFVILFVLAILYTFIIISTAPKIDPENIYDSVAQSSVVYDDQGKKVDTVFYNQDRQLISYKQMPKNMINAFVALEDKTFWKHHGFNWTRMAGAVVQSFTGSGHISGTSTITQQLARNVYLPKIKSQRSVRRKILEMYYASQIERTLSKEQIVEAYLNTIYLGFGSYGVYSASHAYFSKDPKDLSLEECAALAALPQAPDTYALVKLAGKDSVTEGDTNIILRNPDTYIANDMSKNRRDTALKLMHDQGYITDKDFKAAYHKNLIDFINPSVKSNKGVNSYFNEYLIDEVSRDLQKKYDISPQEAERMIYTGGLQIHSTMDSTAQKVAVEEFKNSSNFPSLVSIRKDSSGNVISSSGNIILYDYNDSFNSEGNFTLGKDEVSFGKDGSATIKRGKRLNIYTTKTGGKVNYSLEFKKQYVQEKGTLYIYSGGYINVPSKYKKLDSSDDLVIDKSYFKDFPNSMVKSGNTLVIKPDAYSLNEKTIQPQAAMVIVGVGTGEIKAMVGGRGQSGSRLYNRALNPRQSGSSIKPLSVYGAALQKSYEYAEKGETWPMVDYKHDKQGTRGYGDYLTASSTIVDEPMTFNGKTWPKNSNNRYSGAVSMRKGIQQSINTVAVKIQLQVGNEYSADLLKKFGLTTIVTEGATSDMNSAALALGGLTKGVIPLEMAQAFAVFPNGGVRQSSIAYTTVTDRHGKVLLKSKSKKTKVLDEGVAFIMTDMLKSVITQGIAGPAAVSGTQAGGKTGTTNDKYDIWFDGFTAKYAASLWIGTDVNIRLSSMSEMAARLWGKIMNQIPAAKTGKYNAAPDNVIRIGNEYYTKGTEKGRSSYVRREATTQRQTTGETEADTSDSEQQSSTDSGNSSPSTPPSGPTIPGA
ncbi:transglycosylase domain-containing protein [Mogibacterium sp. CM50]|uniref:transglycosylase domain-containing protein n=1 Tax=Mogibacterium sp. CM50 TaxID=936375 RepID=UPI00027C5479|nr:transglycosylase domain-containing protein [Mogibacterium sp. CM50]EJU19180.1 transglycosylase [Mogibacterium sp. CM50]